MVKSRYQATGVEVEFEPGSRGRVLHNLLSIARVRDMTMGRDYRPLTAVFEKIIVRSKQRVAANTP